MTTIDTITEAQIESLRAGAAETGDLAVVRVCDSALYGHAVAREICVDLIQDAEAMEDES
jgi:hypothetical protein